MDVEKGSTKDILLHLLTGLGAGGIGAAVFGIVMLFTWIALGETISPDAISFSQLNTTGIETVKKGSTLFLYFIILGTFLGLLATSITYVLLQSTITDRYKYKKTLLTHTFFANLVLLVFMLPVYFSLESQWGEIGLILSESLHVVFIGIFIFYLLEFLHRPKMNILQLYANIFAIIVLLFVLSYFFASNPATIAFLVFPIVFGIFSAGKKLIENIYATIYQSYGMNFLDTKTKFGEYYEGKNKEKE